MTGICPPIRQPQGATKPDTEASGSTTYSACTIVGPSLTCSTGDRVKVSIYCGTIQNSTNADYALASFEVTSASSIAASDTYSMKMRNATGSVLGDWAFGATFYINVVPGMNTFNMRYRAAVGGNITVTNRQIIVEPA